MPKLDVSEIISRFSGVKPTGQDQWQARCPAHDDKEASMRITKAEDKMLLKCYAGCTFDSIISEVGLEPKDLFFNADDTKKQEEIVEDVCVATLSRNKMIPQKFLEDLGVENLPGGKGVKITYKYETGVLAHRQRLRTALSAKKGSRWTVGKGNITLYGLWKIEEMRKWAKSLLIVEGECLPGDAEVLTEHGWQAFEDYAGGKVAQWLPGGKLEMVAPSRIVKQPFAGNMVRFTNRQRFFAQVTPEHKMVLTDRQLGNVEWVRAKSHDHSPQHIPRVGLLDGPGIDLTDDEIKFAIATLADASIHERKAVGHYAFVHLKKERKIERLIGILQRLGIEYSATEPENEPGHIYIKYNVPVKFDFINRGRSFPESWIMDATLFQRKLILEEMVLWDGNRVTNRNQVEFSSKNYSDAKWMQTMSATTGFASTIMERTNSFGRWYKVSVLLSKQTTSNQKSLHKEEIPFDGDVYCLTVPSGMFLVRQDGCISVTGNSDCWTAWYHEMPAIGLPGATMAKLITLDHVKAFERIYLWEEPDKGGETFTVDILSRLAQLKYAGKVFVIKGSDAGAKDLNDLHRAIKGVERKAEFVAAVVTAKERAKLQDLSNAEAIKVAIDAASQEKEVMSSDGLTDEGNARRLVRLHGQDIRYVHEWKKWLVWDGTRWCVDSGGMMIDRLAVSVIAEIYREASDASDKSERRKIAAWAKTSESNNRIRAMIDRTKSRVSMTVEQLDSGGWLFNCINGTLNLKSGILQSHNRNDYLTKITYVKYDPAADAPIFTAFLERAMQGNQDMIRFLQRAIGYSMTGDTGEECLFFIYGEGRNGKTKFLESLGRIFGDYSSWASSDSFMEQKYGNTVRNDLAALAGVRFAPTEETADGKALSEAMVKKLTGGGAIQARFLYSDFFEFAPQFKIWLASNNKPIIRGDEVAIWDRIHLIPFTVYIPPEERDKALASKLAAEGPGILRWAVEGCLEWQRRGGLFPPTEVQEATEDYRNEMDKLKDFLEDECVLASHARVSTAGLWKAYEKWGEEQGEKYLLNRRRFKQQLEKRDIKQGRTMKERFWQGIGLISDYPSWYEDQKKDKEQQKDRPATNKTDTQVHKYAEKEQVPLQFPLKGKV